MITIGKTSLETANGVTNISASSIKDRILKLISENSGKREIVTFGHSPKIEEILAEQGITITTRFSLLASVVRSPGLNCHYASELNEHKNDYYVIITHAIGDGQEQRKMMERYGFAENTDFCFYNAPANKDSDIGDSGEDISNGKRKVLILGGTGRMSEKLSLLCLANGDDVTISVRGRHKINDKLFGTKKIFLDRLNEVETRMKLGGRFFDVVFDCSGFVPQCVEWVLSSLKTNRYIFVSSFEVYSHYQSGYDLAEDVLPLSEQLFEEKVAIGSKAWYPRGKRSSELLLANRYQNISFAIVRIPFVMSLNDNDFEDELSSRILKYVSAVMNGQPINSKGVERRLSFVENNDEANFLYFLSKNDFKGVVNFASQGYITMNDVIEYISKKTGKQSILDQSAPGFPFTHHPEVVMNLDRCLELQFTPQNINDWIYQKINIYIEYCRKNLLNSGMLCSTPEIKNWLVTGGSTGFGRALVLRLHELGYTVTATSRDISKLNDLPDGIFKIKLDVRDINSCRNAIKIAIQKMGRIDVLVNNAGVSHLSNFEETPDDIAENVIATNYWGVSNMCKTIIPHMRENRNGTVVNISSACGLRASNYGAYYVASKFAVENLTKNLKFECQKFMRFMTVAPGGMATELHKHKTVIHTKIPEYKNLPPIYPFKGGRSINIGKAVNAVINTVNQSKLPRSLILGWDAYQQFQQALKVFENETEEYKHISITTDLAKKEKIFLEDITLPRNPNAKIQNWLITGGSGGFGKILALRLNQLGYTVTVTSRNMAALDSLPDSIHKIESQLGSAEDCEMVIKSAVEKMGTVDVLVNNATSNCWCSFEECPDDIMRKVFHVNYMVPQYLIKSVLPYMRSNKNGTVINISSVAGLQPRARVSTYSAAKAALEGLTRVLKSECQRFARFMAVEPVCMRTSIMFNNPVIETKIEDYSGLGRYTQQINNIPNRCEIAAQQIINVVNQDKLPQSLPIGTEGYLIAKNEIKRARIEFASQKDITLSVCNGKPTDS